MSATSQARAARSSPPPWATRLSALIEHGITSTASGALLPDANRAEEVLPIQRRIWLTSGGDSDDPPEAQRRRP